MDLLLELVKCDSCLIVFVVAFLSNYLVDSGLNAFECLLRVKREVGHQVLDEIQSIQVSLKRGDCADGRPESSEVLIHTAHECNYG